MLYRVFGRKKYGKTSYCIDVIEKCVEQKKTCYYIVPEQFTFSCEKMITDRIGNRANLYVEVLSFTRLCNRVFRKYGGISKNYLDSVGKTLCMSRVLKSFGNELSEYSSCAEDISFASCAVKTVEEFSSYNISSDDINRAILEIEGKDKALSGKLSDISLLSSAYRAELKAIFGTDGESIDMLCKTLDKHDFFKNSLVVVDSFYGYTPQELNVLSYAIRQAEQVHITFCTNKDDDDAIFQRATEAAFKIKNSAENDGVDVEDICLERPDLDDDISYIERNFTTEFCMRTVDVQTSDKGENISIIRCKNPMDESKAVCAKIYSLLSDNKTHFRDIAICARNIASYEGIIDVYLEKAGITFSYSVREDLLTKPIISYVLTTIDFVLSWKQQSFITLLKTGLVRLCDDECSLLESYIRTWNINGKKGFLTEWYMNPSGYSAVFSEKDSHTLDLVNSAKETVLSDVMKFYEDVSQANTCKEIAAAVFRLMSDSSYEDKINDEDDVRFWDLTVKALDEIVKVYADDEMSSKQFAELFRTVINEYGILDIPETCDSVLIGSVDLIRSETVKYMFVLGCNNEYFPLLQSEDSLFSDNEKALLESSGIRISTKAKDRAYDEFFLAYNIFCDPYEKLFMLYSQSDLDGKNLKRSVLLDTVQALFIKDLEVEYPYLNFVENISNAASLAEIMYDIPAAEYVQASRKVLSETEDMKNVFSESVHDICNGKISEEKSHELFGHTVCSSPSRFETYSRCRFCYFNRYLLKIKPEPKAELDSLQTGLISHKILELFVKELAKSKLDGNIYSHDKARERIKELLDAHFADITHSSNRRDAISKRFTYLYNRLYIILSALADHLVDDLSQSKFVPSDFEVNIGLSDDTIKSVPIDLVDDEGNKRGELRIVGQVDRADVYKKDDVSYVRIIDYKTGHKSFKKSDVAYGFNLQMLLYLYCIALSETKRYGEKVVPAGVLYIPVRKPEIKDAVLGDDTQEASIKALKNAFKGDGLLIDDMDVLDAMDSGITGRFVPASLSSSGGFNKVSSKVESLEKMGELLDLAAEVSGKLAALMYDGNIQTNPYRNTNISSCEHCDYRSVCRIDRKNENIRFEMEEVL